MYMETLDTMQDTGTEKIRAESDYESDQCHMLHGPTHTFSYFIHVNNDI
jgi:hypothetical protein